MDFIIDSRLTNVVAPSFNNTESMERDELFTPLGVAYLTSVSTGYVVCSWFELRISLLMQRQVECDLCMFGWRVFLCMCVSGYVLNVTLLV